MVTSWTPPSNFFFEKSCPKICGKEELCIPLHSQTRNNGSVAQLNRASDYGSEGYRFESCRSHNFKRKSLNGSVAQLNRASDYGSEGYRFESCRSHKNRTTIMWFCFLLLIIVNFALRGSISGGFVVFLQL